MSWMYNPSWASDHFSSLEKTSKSAFVFQLLPCHEAEQCSNAAKARPVQKHEIDFYLLHSFTRAWESVLVTLQPHHCTQSPNIQRSAAQPASSCLL